MNSVYDFRLQKLLGLNLKIPCSEKSIKVTGPIRFLLAWVIGPVLKSLIDNNILQNGTITVIGSLDRDKCISSRYPFTVIARDNGSSRRTVS